MSEIASPNAAPGAAAETFATQEAAQAEYKRFMSSPEFQQAQASPNARHANLARLEALAKAAWPTPGVQASPAPGSAAEARQHAERHVDILSGATPESLSGEPLTEADAQAMADAFAPRSATDFVATLPGMENAELRQTLFDHGVSKSAAGLIAAGEGLIEPTLALDDASYYARVDKALATVRGKEGGHQIAVKAFQLVDSIPADHFYRPFAEYLLTMPGGVVELAHFSDRLRAKGAAS